VRTKFDYYSRDRNQAPLSYNPLHFRLYVLLLDHPPKLGQVGLAPMPKDGQSLQSYRSEYSLSGATVAWYMSRDFR
jgi:hypothetical protein